MVDAGEVLRQASAVIGRPVTLWEVTGAHEAVPCASSDDAAAGAPPAFDLDATLRRWNVPILIGSRWIAAPGPAPDAWVIAPVRSRPPAPRPGGRERRSRERLALELAGLVLGLIDSQSAPMTGHDVSHSLVAARTGLRLSMESIGRWVDLAADRRLALLDDLGQVLEDLDRSTAMLRAMQDSARAGRLTARAEGAKGGGATRFDAVRVVRSCLTLERRLLRDRGIDLDFKTALEALYLKGDPNALFDLLVNLVRNAADATAGQPSPLHVQLDQKGKDLELIVGVRGVLGDLAKVRSVVETVFKGTVSVDSAAAGATMLTIALPLPPQREGDVRRA